MRLSVPTTLIAALAFATAAHAEAPGWTVQVQSGTVTAYLNGRTQPLATGTIVPDGALLIAGRDARLVLASGSDRLTLSPGARISLADPRRGGTSGQVTAEAGVALLEVARSDGTTFNLRTPLMSVAASRATLNITVSSGGTAIRAIAGAADTATLDKGARRQIGTGTVAMVTADRPDCLMLDGAVRAMVEPASNGVRVAALP